MAIKPLHVATGGYLNSPLSVAADGYLYIAASIGGGSSDNYYKSSILAEQIQREDEEIISIVMSFMGIMK